MQEILHKEYRDHMISVKIHSQAIADGQGLLKRMAEDFAKGEQSEENKLEQARRTKALQEELGVLFLRHHERRAAARAVLRILNTLWPGVYEDALHYPGIPATVNSPDLRDVDPPFMREEKSDGDGHEDGCEDNTEEARL